MPVSPAALGAAPYPEDQLNQIKRLIAGSTAEQRVWLSGYLAGFQAATESRAAPAAPSAPKAPLTILYATESGNSETLAATARKAAQRMGFSAKALDMADATPEQVARPGNLLVIASTWGEGDPPQRAESFYAALMADTAPRFKDVKFSVLALGDRAYANFCQIGQRIDDRLAELGGTRIAPRLDCDVDYEAPANKWIDARLRKLEGDTGSAVIHVDFARPAATEEAYSRSRPFEAEINEIINLNGSRATAQTFHVELSLAGSGMAYEPGDAIGFLPSNDPALVEDVLRLAGITDSGIGEQLSERFDINTLTREQVTSYATLTADAKLGALAKDPAELASFLQDRQLVDLLAVAPNRLTAEQLTGLLRPLQPRLYSVASSRAAVGEEAHLLIGAVRWESHGRVRKGVASADVAERRKAGGSMKVYVKPNTHFRLPADPAQAVIMIGPGTGVAPFRGFLQEREATGATGRNWLFFGARNFTHDFLYQLEWQDWAKSGVLSRIDLAFSRDQREKIYVQHRMWEARRELFAWLEDAAALYVCGDAKSMAKDVQATLQRIVAAESGRSDEGAAEYLRGLQKSGRYLKDVY
ncbi:MAG: flavodoxin domain-containing protein [Acetobacteraceae bacterium]|nr:flavodoxin domain-containing protein [Acetobacteraceae bacterium]